MPKYAFIEDNFNLEKFLSTIRANREFVTATYISLISVYLCKYVHTWIVVNGKIKSIFL